MTVKGVIEHLWIICLFSFPSLSSGNNANRGATPQLVPAAGASVKRRTMTMNMSHPSGHLALSTHRPLALPSSGGPLLFCLVDDED